MTYTQQRDLVRKGLRNLRRVYRRADTEGEKFERHLDRLINRKTLVGVAELEAIATEYKAWQRLVSDAEQATADTINVRTAYA